MAQVENEPSYDMEDAVLAGIDSQRPQLRPVEPIAALATLSATGDLGPDERDAGQILHRMHRVASAGLRNEGRYDWRLPTGSWSTIAESRLATRTKVDLALNAIGTPVRRKAVTLACIAETPHIDFGDTSALSCGLTDVARFWWGRASGKTHVRNGMTMAGSYQPTPERLQHDNDNVATPDGARWVVEGFERMAARQQLDENRAVNFALHAAGLRYQTDHYTARLTPLGAIDYERPHVDGSPGDTFGSDRSVMALDAFRKARAAMGGRYAAVVDAVLLDGRTLAEAGVMHSSYRQRDMAGTVAKERLTTGLRTLAVHYGIMSKQRVAA